MDSASLLVWVLFLIMPGNMPDVAIAQPMLTLEECDAKKARAAGAVLLMCLPQYLAWDSLT